MATLQTAAGTERRSTFDPARSLWRLLTSVRFALMLIGFLAAAALAGILIPQLPADMRGNPAAEAAWFEFQRRSFGSLTDPMTRLGFFEIFRSLWFAAGLATLVVSVCVCTANRLGPVWRNATHPQTRVPDDYFERGQPVITIDDPRTEQIVAELKRRHYRVVLTQEGGTAYLFADRFAWAQLATFVSHLALILFIAGGLVSVMTGKEAQVFIGEGSSTPVFALTDPDHLQIYVEDAVGRFDETGFPLDFRTYMVVYSGGQEIARGVTTVNSPLSVNGFNFHQSFYFPDGIELRVRDLTTGRYVYNDVVPLDSSATTPRIVVRDAGGALVLDDLIIPTDFLPGVAGTEVSIPGWDRRFWIGSRGVSETGAWQLVVFETGREGGAQALLDQGGTLDLGEGLSLSFAGLSAIPSSPIIGLPGAEGQAIVEMSDGPNGKLITVGPVAGRAVVLAENDSAVVGNYEYTFAGLREFAGITVRRDPGSTFIWLATGLLLLGLALTFYTPRRRLWGKLADGQGAFRGLGGRATAVEREVREAAARAAAK